MNESVESDFDCLSQIMCINRYLTRLNIKLYSLDILTLSFFLLIKCKSLAVVSSPLRADNSLISKSFMMILFIYLSDLLRYTGLISQFL